MQKVRYSVSFNKLNTKFQSWWCSMHAVSSSSQKNVAFQFQPYLLQANSIKKTFFDLLSTSKDELASK